MSEPINPTNGRAFDRKDVLFAAKLVNGEESVDCEILNISFGGAQVRVEKLLDYGENVSLDIDPFGSFNMEVRWVDNKSAGLRFEDDRTKVAELVMAIATYA